MASIQISPTEIFGSLQSAQTSNHCRLRAWLRLLFYICHDEITPGGASFYCEVLSRTVQHIKKICVDKRLRFPDQLVLQSDNTTAQAKNSETLRYLAQLVGRGIFSVVILNFLIVGHTHEDIDRIFAYLRSAVIKKHLFQTPQEFCEYILLEMPKFFTRHDEVVLAIFIGDICDFNLWLEGQAVHYHNCFVKRNEIDVPHSFALKRRTQLSASEKFAIAAPDAAGHETDVFAITKRWMHSLQRNGPPVLVLPAARWRRVRALHPHQAKASVPLTRARQQHLLQLANALESMTAEWEPGTSYYRGARALRDFVSGASVPSLSLHAWLFEPREALAIASTGNQFFDTLPEMAWRMSVRFRDLTHDSDDSD